MPLIPLFIQNELDAGDDPERWSAFNFCDPFDAVLPFANSEISALDRQHLWGLSTGISAAIGPTEEADVTHTLQIARRLVRHKFRWISDADGNALSDSVAIFGTLDRLVTQPSKPAAYAPTDNYDITLLAAGDMSEDLLQGLAANRDAVNTETAWIYRATTTGDLARVEVAGFYRLQVANAGAAKAGVAALYVILD